MDFRSRLIALRAVLFVVARAGREFAFMPVAVVRGVRKSSARDDTAGVFERVAVRARVAPVRDVVLAVRLTTLVAVRDWDAVSRDATFDVVVEFVRDKESVPRTAADDAPNDSAIIIMETIIPFISFKEQVSKK